MLIGCAQKESEKPTIQDTTDTITAPKQPDSTETVETQPPLQLPPEKCDSTISQDDITHIDLSAFKEGLNITKEGFSFRIILLDMDNNTVPANGNIGLTIFSTKWWNDELVNDLEIYQKSILLKKEEVNSDCSSKEIFVKFDDIKKQPNYRYVKEEDPGVLRIEFKRSYSNDLYEIEYIPYEFGEDILP